MSQRIRRIDRLGWYIVAAVVLALIGVIVPWALTRGQLAPGWTSAKVNASIRSCDTARYPAPSGADSAASCRCVTAKASHSVPLRVSSYALADAGQAEIQRDTGDCNRQFP
ncbi:MAG TPA: hypothetical protein VG223_05660 [Solirubrobacteraceae bacterium]|nr:hypothetical protein [Solirubrobacteraceae bacterium]